MRRLFDIPFGDGRVEVRCNVPVGERVTIAELRRSFDAVILAHGASMPRGIEPPVPASHQAVDVLAAANEAGAQGVSARLLQGPDVAVVGGGNVALDVVASMVRGRVETVAGESITRIRVISRSAPDRPSFTASALHELAELGAVPVVDRGAELLPEPLRRLLSDHVADEIAGRTTVTLSFGNEVTACCATGSGVRVLTATGRVFAADSVVCAMGFTAAVLDGVPMRPDGVVSNGGGRVVCPDSGVPVAGLYVVGWAKRGAKGGLGDNRRCAAETVDKIVADMTAEVSGR